MDTSEQYIKMCEKATEIQSSGMMGWRPDDVIVGRSTFKVYGKAGYMLYCQLGCKSTNEQDDWIWLPRQDQLQDMIRDQSDKVYDWMAHLGQLNNFTSEFNPHGESFPDYVWQFNTWEQLWLAFVMKEKYNKTWNGEDWVEE